MLFRSRGGELAKSWAGPGPVPSVGLPLAFLFASPCGFPFDFPFGLLLAFRPAFLLGHSFVLLCFILCCFAPEKESWLSPGPVLARCPVLAFLWLSCWLSFWLPLLAFLLAFLSAFLWLSFWLSFSFPLAFLLAFLLVFL